MQQMTEDQGREAPPLISSEEAMADWPPEAQEAGKAVIQIISSNEENVIKFVHAAGSLVRGAASFVFSQINEAEKRFGDVPDDILYADGGLSDLAMALVFRILQDAGLEGADDINAYHEALNEVDNLAGFAGQSQEGQEEAPPPQGRGMPVMAGG